MNRVARAAVDRLRCSGFPGLAAGWNRPLLLLTMLLGGLVSGCGAEIYNERVERTKKLFEYHQKLDENLQGLWSRPELGVSMRVPRGYTLLPAPPLPKELEDGTLEVVEDMRPLLGIELPGLVEAWQMADSQGRLFFCSNHQRLIDQQTNASAPDPATFFSDLELALQQGLSFTLAADDVPDPGTPNAKFFEKIPSDAEFAVAKDFTTIAISPGEIENIDPLSGHVYEYQNGPVQAAFVLIYLKSIPQDPNRPLRVALETLEISGDTPKATGKPGAAGASGKGPGF